MTDASHDALELTSDDGTQLMLHRLGGSGPALLICHATGFHGRAYLPLAHSFAQHFTVWAIDMRAHGAAGAPINGDFSWQRMGEDVLAAIDTLGGSPLHAFGHSMGGAAILLAEIARPGIITAAFMYEPIIFPEAFLAARDENPLAAPTRRRRELFASREAALARYASRPPLNILRADALHAYVADGFVDLPDGTVRLACRAEVEARTYESEGYATLERIHGLRLDVTVAAGERGLPPNPAQFAPTITDAIEGAHLRWYEDLGHFGPLQAPDVIARDALAALHVTETPHSTTPESLS